MSSKREIILTALLCLASFVPSTSGGQIAKTHGSKIEKTAAVADQNARGKDIQKVLEKAPFALWNLTQAITTHQVEDPTFVIAPQEPADPRPLPPLLIKKDNSIVSDWTPGQEARYYMEELRQGLHTLQSAKKRIGLDELALDQARRLWQGLREISCKDAPGTRYYDLDGIERYCGD